MAIDDFDPEGRRLPIKIDRTSNGEYRAAAADLEASSWRDVSRTRRRPKMRARSAFPVAPSWSRRPAPLRRWRPATPPIPTRAAAISRCPTDAARDQELAAATVGGDEFIFDVQTHCVEPSGRWSTGETGRMWRTVLERVFGQASKCTSGSFDCYSAQTLAKEVFLDSDTDVAVVSALWGIPNPTPIDYAAESREIVAAMGGEGARALIHGGVFPNEPGEIDAMDEKAQRFRVAAWKLYPQWGSNGRGFFLDRSDEANRFFEKARSLGVKTVAVHKGVPLAAARI